MLYVAILLHKEGKVKDFLRLALPFSQLKESTAVIYRAVLLGSLLALGLAVFLGWAIARYLSRPIVRMTKLVGFLAQGDLACCRADVDAP